MEVFGQKCPFWHSYLHEQKCVISDEVDERCALLGYHAASTCNSLPTFRDNISVASSRMKNPKRNLEDGTNTLFRNVGKELPLIAA